MQQGNDYRSDDDDLINNFETSNEIKYEIREEEATTGFNRWPNSLKIDENLYLKDVREEIVVKKEHNFLARPERDHISENHYARNKYVCKSFRDENSSLEEVEEEAVVLEKHVLKSIEEEVQSLDYHFPLSAYTCESLRDKLLCNENVKEEAYIVERHVLNIVDEEDQRLDNIFIKTNDTDIYSKRLSSNLSVELDKNESLNDVKAAVDFKISDYEQSVFVDELEESTKAEGFDSISRLKNDEKANKLQGFRLPVTFFDVQNNVYLLSRCRPLTIKLYDLKKIYKSNIKNNINITRTGKPICLPNLSDVRKQNLAIKTAQVEPIQKLTSKIPLNQETYKKLEEFHPQESSPNINPFGSDDSLTRMGIKSIDSTSAVKQHALSTVYDKDKINKNKLNLGKINNLTTVIREKFKHATSFSNECNNVAHSKFVKYPCAGKINKLIAKQGNGHTLKVSHTSTKIPKKICNFNVKENIGLVGLKIQGHHNPAPSNHMTDNYVKKMNSEKIGLDRIYQTIKTSNTSEYKTNLNKVVTVPQIKTHSMKFKELVVTNQDQIEYSTVKQQSSSIAKQYHIFKSKNNESVPDDLGIISTNKYSEEYTIRQAVQDVTSTNEQQSCPTTFDYVSSPGKSQFKCLKVKPLATKTKCTNVDIVNNKRKHKKTTDVILKEMDIAINKYLENRVSARNSNNTTIIETMNDSSYGTSNISNKCLSAEISNEKSLSSLPIQEKERISDEKGENLPQALVKNREEVNGNECTNAILNSCDNTKPKLGKQNVRNLLKSDYKQSKNAHFTSSNTQKVPLKIQKKDDIDESINNDISLISVPSISKHYTNVGKKISFYDKYPKNTLSKKFKTIEKSNNDCNSNTSKILCTAKMYSELNNGNDKKTAKIIKTVSLPAKFNSIIKNYVLTKPNDLKPKELFVNSPKVQSNGSCKTQVGYGLQNSKQSVMRVEPKTIDLCISPNNSSELQKSVGDNRKKSSKITSENKGITVLDQSAIPCPASLKRKLNIHSNVRLNDQFSKKSCIKNDCSVEIKKTNKHNNPKTSDILHRINTDLCLVTNENSSLTHKNYACSSTERGSPLVYSSPIVPEQIFQKALQVMALAGSIELEKLSKIQQNSHNLGRHKCLKESNNMHTPIKKLSWKEYKSRNCNDGKQADVVTHI